ncbi:serine/threonine protein kinase [Paenibacillus lactis]|uniref:serine/threonine protein kinase n=1 Tax=Paenibacillus lactis TaxID=228574 RepID=UPI00367E208C
MRLFSYAASFIAAWRDYPAEADSILGNRYTVQGLLGEGSYGITYRCEDLESKELVAVKQARPSKGPFAKKLLRREAALLKSLAHPHIPAYKDLFTYKNKDFLVMSYIEGDTLEDLIFDQGFRYTEQECLRITLQLLEIVTYIHDQGIIHLDLRIPNVLFKNGELQLIDFGLARRVGEPPPLQKPKQRWTRKSRLDISIPAKSAEENSDLADIGHFMLFMLYSAYDVDDDPDQSERSWQEELILSAELHQMIERLLGIREPYQGSSHFMNELRELYSSYDPTISGMTHK